MLRLITVKLLPPDVPSVIGIFLAEEITVSEIWVLSLSVSLATSPVTPKATMPVHPNSSALVARVDMLFRSKFSLSTKGVASIQCTPLKFSRIICLL